MNGYADIVGEDGLPVDQPAGLPSGTRVRVDPRTARTLYATAATQTVAAGASATFQIQVQVPMRIEQLIIVDETNGDATIARVSQLRVGPSSQIVSNNAQLPLRMFSPFSFLANMLKGNTAVPGSDVLVEILNTSGQPATFIVAMKGTALST